MVHDELNAVALASRLGLSSVEGEHLSALQTVAKSLSSTRKTVEEALPQIVLDSLKSPENIFGKFVLTDRLGEGAMGEVWKAYDLELLRFVALKFIKSQRAEELKVEARTLASLEHKNIARIYEIGSARGQDFITMQYIDGITLQHARYRIDETLRAVETVCVAVDFAHKRGIIHRDLKPENIMIDRDGNLFVMDFGLAVKGAVSGEIAGTPGYMAPEIAVGEQSTVRSDVFSLGATLYFLLTEIPPLSLASDDKASTILEKCRRGIQVPIERISASCPKEICAIVAKSTAVDADNRYESAKDMAEDISRFLNGDAVQAYGSGAAYRASKFIRKNRRALLISCLCICTLAAALFFAGERKSEEEQRQQLQTQLAGKHEKIDKLIRALISDLSSSHVEALKRRKAGEPFANLEGIPTRILDSAVYRECEAEAQNSAEVHYSLGRLYRIIGDPVRAENEQKKALEINPAHHAANYELGFLTFLNYEDCVHELRDEWLKNESSRRRSVGFKPLSVPETARIENDEARNLKQTALRHFRSTRHDDPLSISITALLEGRIQDAEKTFVDVLKKNPSEQDAVAPLANIIAARNEYGNCIKLLTAAIADDRGNTEFYTSRARVYHNMTVAKMGTKEEPFAEIKMCVDDWGKVIELQPANQLAMLNRGKTLLNSGWFKFQTGKDPHDDYELADSDFQAVTDRNPANASAWMNRGLLAIYSGVYTRTHGGDPATVFANAEKFLEKSHSLGNRGIYFYQTRALLSQERAIYRGARGEDPGADYAAAIADLDAALNVNMNSYDGWVNRGGTRVNWAIWKALKGQDPTEDYRAAEEDFERAVKINPNDSMVWLNRGHARANIGNFLMNRGKDPTQEYVKALQHFDEAIRLAKGDFEAWFSRARLRMLMGNFKMTKGRSPMEDYGRGEEDYDAALKINPASFEGWNYRGNLWANAGTYKQSTNNAPSAEYDKALECYENALAINSADFRVQMSLGQIWTNKGVLTMGKGGDPRSEFERALKALDESVRLNESNFEPPLFRGVLYGSWLMAARQKITDADASELYKKALADLEAAIKMNPVNGEPFMHRGTFHYTMDEFSAALKDFEKAAKLNPNLVPRYKHYWDDTKRRVGKEDY